ncbi:phage tail tape measure protein [Sodalis ligni]|uniref:phage tail tape measure protein n=1 Tax=Sodalis ligni TaxID=2697027 RepID=UPI00193F9E90|nr:phage tail tape measure protein [Sodalis ligni]QWA09520.1 phage tail tape measure protein [Sodalis ligni]
MPQETGSLIIKVTQDGVAKAADALDNLTAASVSAETAVNSLSSEFADVYKSASLAADGTDIYTHQTAAMNRGAQDAAKTAKAVNSNLADQQAALESLLGRIDPVVGAYARLEAMQEQLKGFNASGLLPEEEYDNYTDKINAYRIQLEQASAAATTGHKAEAAAAREAAQAEMQEQATKASFIARLKEQSETMGMTTAQLLEYKAAQLGVTAEVAPYIQKLTQQDGTVKAATLSAKEYSQALRYLPMQITDVVTSLASGMPVWLIAIQQGGQIKDSFGGIGNAFAAAGRYAIGLVAALNPLTVAITAAVVGSTALAIAFKQGNAEMDGYNQAIITTGRYAGVSADQLADMAKSISSNVGTTSQAAKALSDTLSSGQFSGGQLKSVAQAAVAMQDATGKAIDATIAEFQRLEQDPVSASESLNNQYHYLTAAVYEQITALERQGNTQQAAAVAVSAYATAELNAANDVKNNMGALESAWDAVARAAKGAWDAMMDIGRAQTPADKIKTATATVNNIQSSLAGLDSIDTSQGGMLTGGVANAKARLKEQLIAAQNDLSSALLTNQRDLNKAASNQATAYYNDQAVQATKSNDALYTAVLTKAQQRQKDIEQLNKNMQNHGVLPTDPFGKQLTYDDMVQQINDKYKDPKTPKAKAVTDNQATRMLLEMQGQEASLQGQVDSESKLGTWEQKRLAFIQLIADLQGKSILTADQKSLLANQAGLEVEFDKLAALEKQAKQQQDIIKLQERAAQLNDTMASAYNGAADQYARQIAAVGLGDKEAQRVDSTKSIYTEYQRYQEQLDKATPKDALDSDAYKQETANIKTQLAARLKLQSDSYAKLDELQSQWSVGASEAYQNYLDSAKDIAGQTKTAFTDAFSGMEDALVSFVTTGKLNFSSFATSVLNDLARIAIKSAESSFLQGVVSIASGLFGGAGGASSGANAGTAISSSANQSLSLNAKGGVYDSPSLSAYSGRVVDRPTLFAFAAGGGVMGEAGPEAILPLSRGSDGSLGVRAKGSSNASGTTINAPITLNVDQRGNTNDQQQQNNATLLKTLQKMVDSRINSALVNQKRDGGLLA